MKILTCIPQFLNENIVTPAIDLVTRSTWKTQENGLKRELTARIITRSVLILIPSVISAYIGIANPLTITAIALVAICLAIAPLTSESQLAKICAHLNNPPSAIKRTWGTDENPLAQPDAEGRTCRYEIRGPNLSAVEYGKVEVVNVLLSAGATVSATNKYGESPLMLAAENGDPSVVLALLEAGAAASATDNDKKELLMWAAYEEHTEIVAALIPFVSDFDKNQALLWAAEHGKVKFVLKFVNALKIEVLSKVDQLKLLRAALKERSDTSIADTFVNAGVAREPYDLSGIKSLAEFNEFTVGFIISEINLNIRRLFVRELVTRPITEHASKSIELDPLKPLVYSPSKHSPEKYEQLCEARLALSETATRTNRFLNEITKSRENWKDTDKLVAQWAKQKTPLTLDRILEINQKLCNGLENNGGEAGVLREHEIRAGMDRKYLSKRHVEIEMKIFMDWLEKGLEGCENGKINPILLAAQAYQRLVSIHPFSDGNGRTTRMVMDYILQRYGLPPAALKDKNVAVFGEIDSNIDCDQAVKIIKMGIEESCNILGVEVPFKTQTA